MCFICPMHKKSLSTQKDCMQCPQGCAYTVRCLNGQHIVDFSDQILSDNKGLNKVFYDGSGQNSIYKNYLEWLFSTFMTEEQTFRKNLLERLKLAPSSKILITGCGNGDDILAISKSFPGMNFEIHAQDISREMICFAADTSSKGGLKNIKFSISDATNLPYTDNFFDRSFHFGGINLMPDIKKAISEMTRVVKHNGMVAFGDEGIAPWLRNTEYCKMMVENNSLWSAGVPLELLPETANCVNVTWILENCFYFVDFIKDCNFPTVNIDVPHKGSRGGSIRTRYYGKLEGVSQEAQSIATAEAKNEGISIHVWLDKLIKTAKIRK